jgi:regulator of sigma E protease
MFSQPPLWFIIIAFLCAIGPLVFFHELGHYWVARWLGVGAEQFSIGFGREVTGWTDKRGTRWKVGWLPLGGYVRFVGDMNPASQPDPNAAIPDEERAGEGFPLPTLVATIPDRAGRAGGQFPAGDCHFRCFFALFGMPRTPAIVSQVSPVASPRPSGFSPATGSRAIAGQDIRSFEDMRRIVSIRPGDKSSSPSSEQDDRSRLKRYLERGRSATIRPEIPDRPARRSGRRARARSSPPSRSCQRRRATPSR